MRVERICRSSFIILTSALILMLNDPINFLHSMCLYVAARAITSIAPPVPINYAVAVGNAPWNLFLNQADEDAAAAADPYAVIRIFSGTHERTSPKATISCQLAVYGSSNVAAWTLANALYRCFCLTNQEMELRAIVFSGQLLSGTADGTWKLIQAVTRNTPGAIGRDDRGRLKIVSNFDLEFLRATLPS